MNDNLILENLKYINYTILKMGLDLKNEDYYGAGLIGLINACNNYDETKEVNFKTYIITCIRYEIIKQFNFNKREKRKSNYFTVSFDAPLYEDKIGNVITLYDLLDSSVDVEKEYEIKNKIELLYKIIAILDEKDRFIINHYFGIGNYKKMYQKKIAKILNVKQSYVSYRIKRSMRIIKKIMEDKYGEEN